MSEPKPIYGQNWSNDTGPRQRIAELTAEVERLKSLGIEQAENSPILSVGIQDGAVEVALRPPQWAAQALAMSFYEILADAPNWQALEVGPLEANGVKLIVTVCRKDGETPVETVRKLREEVERLKGENAQLKEDEITRQACQRVIDHADLQFYADVNEAHDKQAAEIERLKKENDGYKSAAVKDLGHYFEIIGALGIDQEAIKGRELGAVILRQIKKLRRAIAESRFENVTAQQKAERAQTESDGHRAEVEQLRSHHLEILAALDVNISGPGDLQESILGRVKSLRRAVADGKAERIMMLEAAKVEGSELTVWSLRERVQHVERLNQDLNSANEQLRDAVRASVKRMGGATQ